jgi:hypothetical protein
MTLSLIKKPSAWIPIALSLAVLAAMLVFIVALGPPAREPDEGTAAHLFQIWLVLEALLMAYFAATWLPRAPRQALAVLALQVLAVLAACAPVYYFNL